MTIKEFVESGTPEQIEKLRDCKTSEEVLALAKELGISLDEKQAGEFAALLQSNKGEISDELLAKITGGDSLGCGERIPVRYRECPACFAIDSLVKGTESYAICNVCHKKYSERDVYRDFM